MNKKILILAVPAVCLILLIGCKKVEQKIQKMANLGTLDEKVNSPDNELGPVISANGKTMYFTSDREGGLGGEDIWKTRKITGLWAAPVNLGPPLNTPTDEGIDTFSQDEKALYLTSDSRPGGLGKNDIYVSRLVGNKWTEPQNLDHPINTPSNDANASLSADGKTLYFVSDRPEGVGGMDIWVSQLGSDGKWGEPKNLGEPINTTGWEGYVFIAPDGMTLYFSSNGHEGYGGADIFRSHFQNGAWSEPENLGDKINSPGNDTYFSIPASGDVVYLSTTRQGGKGKNDIIELPLPAVFQPKKIVVVIGKVTKKDTGEPMKAWAKIKYRPTRQDMAVAETRPNGQFRISFVPQKELVLMVYTEEEGFNPWYEALSLDLSKDNQVLIRNLEMAPGKKPVLKGAEGEQ